MPMSTPELLAGHPSQMMPNEFAGRMPDEFRNPMLNGDEFSKPPSYTLPPISPGQAPRTVPYKKKRKEKKKNDRSRRQSMPSWERGLRNGDEEEKAKALFPALKDGRDSRPHARMGYGSGWKKDNGLTMAQMWRRHQSDSNIDKRLEARVTNLLKGQDRLGDLWDSKDTNDSKSAMAMAANLRRQNKYLEKQERQLQQRLQSEACRAMSCRWGASDPSSSHLGRS